MRKVPSGKVAVLQLSGGKDSLACLYLYKEQWTDIYVLWTNTGDAFPETLAQMAELRKDLPKFIEVKTDQPTQVMFNGYPVDLLPLKNHKVIQGIVGLRSDRKCQSFLECCSQNMMIPMEAATKALKPDIIIRGQKDADVLKGGLRDGDVVDGIEYWYPIQDWTDDEVKKYLGHRLPKHYHYFNSSLDCMTCTAYLSENLGKRTYTREFHPEVYAEVTRRLQAIREMTEPDRLLLEVAHGGR